MGRNLPEMSPRERREAPWNQTHPEPEVYCPECEWAGTQDDLDMGSACPACGNEKLDSI
jgi:Zn finger protein HypA/HybF involved in hydrogenase expression